MRSSYRKFIKHVSSFTLAMFMLTPALNFVSANVLVEEEPSVVFTIEEEMEVSTEQSGIAVSGRGNNVTVDINVFVDGDTPDTEVADWSMSLYNKDLNYETVVVGGTEVQANIPIGNYAVTFFDVPDGAINGQVPGAEATVVVTNETTAIDITLGEEFGTAKQAAFVTYDGDNETSSQMEYLTGVPIEYTVEQQSDGDWVYLTTVMSNGGAPAYALLNAGTYRVTAQTDYEYRTLAAEGMMGNVDDAVKAYFIMASDLPEENAPVDVTFKITDTTSAAIPNAVVTVEEDGVVTQTGITDADGLVELTVPSSGANLTVYHHGLSGSSEAAAVAEYAQSGNTTVTLTGTYTELQDNDFTVANNYSYDYVGIIKAVGSSVPVVGITVPAGSTNTICKGLSVGAYSLTPLNGGSSITFEVPGVTTSNLTLGDAQTEYYRPVVINLQDSENAPFTSDEDTVISFVDSTNSETWNVLGTYTLTDASSLTVSIPLGAGYLVMTDAPEGYELAQETIIVDSGVGPITATFTMGASAATNYPVTGTVLDDEFEAVVNATIRFTLQSNMNINYTFVTNSLGAFAGEIPAGIYTISYVTGGDGLEGTYWMDPVTYTHIATQQNNTLNLSIGPAPTAKTVNISFVDEESAPVVGVDYTVASTDVNGIGNSYESTATPNQIVLPFDTYVITVTGVPVGYAIPEEMEYVASLTSETNIVITLSTSNETLYDYNVIVTDDNDITIANVTVGLYEEGEGEPTASGTTGANGMTTLQVPAGAYILVLSNVPSTYETPDRETVTINASARKVIVLEAASTGGGGTGEGDGSGDGSGDTQGPPQPETGTLVVTVTADETPCVNTTVTLVDSDDPTTSFSSDTNSNGSVTFRVPAGEYSVTLSDLEGYTAPTGILATVTSGGTTTLPLAYAVDETSGGGGTGSGDGGNGDGSGDGTGGDGSGDNQPTTVSNHFLVTNEAGGSKAGLAFAIYDGETLVKTVTTDRAGKATVTLPNTDKTYRVVAATTDDYTLKQKISFNIEVEDGVLTVPSTVEVDAYWFSNLNSVERSAVEAFTHGTNITIVNSVGDPVPDVTLLVQEIQNSRARSLPYSATFTTGEDGIAHAKVPAAGDYSVSVVSAPVNFDEDYNTTLSILASSGSTTLRSSDFGTGATNAGGIYISDSVDTDGDGDADGGNTTGGGNGNGGNGDSNVKTGTLNVKATYNGNLVSGVVFSITDTSGNTTVHTTSNTVVTIEKPIGPYTVRITDVPNGYAIPNQNSATITVVEDETLVISLVINAANTPEPTGNISVTASFDGNVLPNIGFALLDNNGNAVSSGFTNSYGVLQFSGLKAGLYTLVNTMTSNDYDLLDNMTVSVTSGTTTPVYARLTMKSGPNTNLSLAQGYGALRIKLETSAGVPVSEAGFLLYDSEDEVIEGFTDSNGELVFTDLPVGIYYLVQHEKGDGKGLLLTRKSFAIRSQTISDADLTASGKTGYTVTATVFEDLNANGVYSESNDETYRGARINLLDDEGSILLTAKTNGYGEVTFKNIPEGDYTLQMLKPSGYEYIGKRYGTARDSSMISTRGYYNFTVEEDIDDILFGVVDADKEVNPILGEDHYQENLGNNRFPTLDASEPVPQLPSRQENSAGGLLGNQFLITDDTDETPLVAGGNNNNNNTPTAKPNTGTGNIHIESQPNGSNGANMSGTGNSVSSMPHTRDNGSIFFGNLTTFIAFLFVALVRYKFRDA